MKMYNGGLIIAGLVIFLGLVTLPMWMNMGKADYKMPELKKVTKAKECVMPADEMRKNHMQLLNQWRDWALREGKRTYVSESGKEYNISLQNTCMDCHVSKKDFCDKCHTDAGVSPYCWECHTQPEGY